MFQEKHTRNDYGRYVVPIPWIKDATTLEHSYRKAVKFFLSQEHRLIKNPELKSKSKNFIRSKNVSIKIFVKRRIAKIKQVIESEYV